MPRQIDDIGGPAITPDGKQVGVISFVGATNNAGCNFTVSSCYVIGWHSTDKNWCYFCYFLHYIPDELFFVSVLKHMFVGLESLSFFFS